MSQKPVAIIDIGSNSVRLVVYAGATRSPWTIFNEKVMAGLGQNVSKTGALTPESQQRALDALRRFRLLTEEMGVVRTRVVATAAVREASNGSAFLTAVRKLGFRAEKISGDEEGRLAGLGVLSAIPDANGVVADLGGGSLELVEVADGNVVDSVSMPFGVFRIGSMIQKGENAFGRKIGKAIETAGFAKRARKRPLYLVGGSWRALARLDMLITNYPLPIMHQYRMSTDRPVELQRALDMVARNDLKTTLLSLARLPTLPHASQLLRQLVEELRPSELIVSSFGIREGILYRDLSNEARARDPLLEAAHEAGRGLGRFDEHGALLDRWIAPIFDDSPAIARLRLAACLLADVAWQAHPDFRAERGVDMALHGNWVGVDGPGRVMIAQALYCNFGGGGSFPDHEVAGLCSPEELRLATQWGLAMRLGQRLSGGVAVALEKSRLQFVNGALRLELAPDQEPLYGEVVERRLRMLAGALNVEAEVIGA